MKWIKNLFKKHQHKFIIENKSGDFHCEGCDLSRCGCCHKMIDEHSYEELSERGI